MRRVVALTCSAGLHTAVLAVLVWRSWQPVLQAPSAIAVEQVSPDAITAPDRQLPPADDDLTDRLWEASMLRMDAFAFDVAKIRERMNVLFPFLTLDLMFLDRVSDDLRAARDQLSNPLGPGAAGSSLPPLDMPDASVQGIIDRAWSRRARWKHFEEIAAQISTHHPSRGQAPQLIRLYLDQNILQPYCDGDRRDPRFWAMLENAADHVDFIDFIRSYTRKFPSSRTTTELLFLLDELAQGSRDVILMVMDTRPEEHLAFTRTMSPDAYTLAEAIKDRYGRWAFERALDRNAVRARYNALRLRLLKTIEETTPDGYRAADARFLAGQVLFEMNRLDDAVRVWRSIAPVDGDAYHQVYSEVLEELHAEPPSLRVMQRILAAEYGRWRVFSIDRLRHFGHHCDTF